MAKVIVSSNLFDVSESRLYEEEKGGQTITQFLRSIKATEADYSCCAEVYLPDTDETVYEFITDDKSLDMQVACLVNGKEENPDYVIQDTDSISITILPANEQTANVFEIIGGILLFAGSIALAIVTYGAATPFSAIMMKVGAGLVIAGTACIVTGVIIRACIGREESQKKDRKTDDSGEQNPALKGSQNQPIINEAYPLVVGTANATPRVAGTFYCEYDTTQPDPNDYSPLFGSKQKGYLLYMVGYAPLYIKSIYFDQLPLSRNPNKVLSGKLTYRMDESNRFIVDDEGHIIRFNGKESEREIGQTWDINKISLEISQFGNHRTIYPYSVLQKSMDSAVLYCYDEKYREIAEGKYITWQGGKFRTGLRTNTIVFSEGVPYKVTVGLKFPGGLFREYADSDGNFIYDKIPMNLVIQWRPVYKYVSKNGLDSEGDADDVYSESMGYTKKRYYGWRNFDNVSASVNIPKITYWSHNPVGSVTYVLGTAGNYTPAIKDGYYGYYTSPNTADMGTANGTFTKLSKKPVFEEYYNSYLPAEVEQFRQYGRRTWKEWIWPAMFLFPIPIIVDRSEIYVSHEPNSEERAIASERATQKANAALLQDDLNWVKSHTKEGCVEACNAAISTASADYTKWNNAYQSESDPDKKKEAKKKRDEASNKISIYTVVRDHYNDDSFGPPSSPYSTFSGAAGAPVSLAQYNRHYAISVDLTSARENSLNMGLSANTSTDSNPNWNGVECFSFGKFSGGPQFYKNNKADPSVTNVSSEANIDDAKDEMHFEVSATLSQEDILDLINRNPMSKKMGKVPEEEEGEFDNDLIGNTDVEIDSIQIRVIRLTPCYLDKTTGSGESRRSYSYADVVKWDYVKTYPVDKQKLLDDIDKIDPETGVAKIDCNEKTFDSFEEGVHSMPTWNTWNIADYYSKPLSDLDSENMVTIGLECEPDIIGYLNDSINKLNCDVSAITPAIKDEYVRYWYRSGDTVLYSDSYDTEKTMIPSLHPKLTDTEKWSPSTVSEFESWTPTALEDDGREYPCFYYSVIDSSKSYMAKFFPAKIEQKSIIQPVTDANGNISLNDKGNIISEMIPLGNTWFDYAKTELGKNRDSAGRWVATDSFIETFTDQNAIMQALGVMTSKSLGKDAYCYNSLKKERFIRWWYVQEVERHRFLFKDENDNYYTDSELTEKTELNEGEIVSEEPLEEGFYKTTYTEKSYFYKDSESTGITEENAVIASPYAGQVVYAVEEGTEAAADDTILTLDKDGEEISVKAGVSGKVHLYISQGDTVTENQALASVQIYPVFDEGYSGWTFANETYFNASQPTPYSGNYYWSFRTAKNSFNMLALKEAALYTNSIDIGGEDGPIKYCANSYVSQQQKLNTILQNILVAGRAFWVYDELGRYKFVNDKPRKNPILLITDEDCINSSNTRNLNKTLGGYHISFNDENNGFQTGEIYVLRKGQERDNPTRDIVDIQLPFVTNPSQVWALGTFLLAQSITQRETWTRKLNHIGNNLSIGSLVNIQSSTLLIGSDYSGRIIKVIKGFDNGVEYIYGVITDQMYTYNADYEEDGKNRQGCSIFQPKATDTSKVITLRFATREQQENGIRVTDEGGQTVLFRNVKGQTNTLLFQRRIIVSEHRLDEQDVDYAEGDMTTNYLPEEGNIVAFGNVGAITSKAIVSSLQSDDKGHISVTLYPYLDSVYTAGESMPVYSANMTRKIQDTSVPLDMTATRADMQDALSASVSAQSQIQSVIDGTNDSVGQPDVVTYVRAVATETGINISWDPLNLAGQNGLRNTVQYFTIFLYKGNNADPETYTSSGTQYSYVFDRNTDGYPEYDALNSWYVTVKATNAYGKESPAESEKAYVNTSSYGTWLLEFPEVTARVENRSIMLSIRNAASANSRQTYGDIRFRVRIKRDEIKWESTVYVREKGGVRTYFSNKAYTIEYENCTVNLYDSTAGETTYEQSVSGDPSVTSVFTKDGILFYKDVTLDTPYTGSGYIDTTIGTYTPYFSSKLTVSADNIWYKPAERENPYTSEDNYKANPQPSTDRWVISGGTYIQTMPLYGDYSSWVGGVIDTPYLLDIQAFNEAHEGQWISMSPLGAVSVTALCTSLVDIVKANETAKTAYITELSAISANLGTISGGSFSGNSFNYWKLTTDINPQGPKDYQGAFRVGGVDEYLEVDPVPDGHGGVSGYKITFRVGNFEVSSTASSINGELIVQGDEHSLDRTRITPMGTYYEHRNSELAEWYVIAHQKTSGLLSSVLYSNDNLLITNMDIDERRREGFDIGRAYISDYSRVYHFDTNKSDNKGVQGYTLYKPSPETPEPELRGGDSPSQGIISFEPAILAVAPYSEIGKSLFGQYKLVHPIGTSDRWTCDFWAEYIWAEGQTVFKCGNEHEELRLYIKMSESNYNIFADNEPPYNTSEVLSDSLCYNVALMSDLWIYHEGDGETEIRYFKDLSLEFNPGEWVHFGVILDDEKIHLYVNNTDIAFDRFTETEEGYESQLTLNESMGSFLLDELMIDANTAETSESFTEGTRNKVPWGTLDSRENHFIIASSENSQFHTNLFDTDIFKEKVLEIIREAHTEEGQQWLV